RGGSCRTGHRAPCGDKSASWERAAHFSRVVGCEWATLASTMAADRIKAELGGGGRADSVFAIRPRTGRTIVVREQFAGGALEWTNAHGAGGCRRGSLAGLANGPKDEHSDRAGPDATANEWRAHIEGRFSSVAILSEYRFRA